jgi:hypothetical protein
LRSGTFNLGRALRFIVQITGIGALILWVAESRIARSEPKSPRTLTNALIAISHWAPLTQKTGDGARIAKERLGAVVKATEGITRIAAEPVPVQQLPDLNVSVDDKLPAPPEAVNVPPLEDHPVKGPESRNLNIPSVDKPLDRSEKTDVQPPEDHPVEGPESRNLNTPSVDEPLDRSEKTDVQPPKDIPVEGQPPAPQPEQAPSPVAFVDFLAKVDIPDAECALVRAARAKLGFAGERNKGTIETWKKNPHGTKSQLGQAFRDKIDKYLNEGYTELQPEIAALVAKSPCLSMRNVSPDEITALAKRQNDNPSVFTIVSGMPVEILQHIPSADNGRPPIVQVASQFNGCESPWAHLVELPTYVRDRTQGPGASLTALVAAALRLEFFRAQGYDAMKECLTGCTVTTAEGDKSICAAYPELCQNGYFQPHVIGNTEHLRVLEQWLENHKVSTMAQWVQCEESGAVQLQVFNAAASFQNVKVTWNATDDERTKLLINICRHTLVGQYRALARVAAHTGQDLHLTLVGMGVFHNPPALVTDILRATNEELVGAGVRVFLHAYAQKDADLWGAAIKANNLTNANISLA